jgi:hypothetical protein
MEDKRSTEKKMKSSMAVLFHQKEGGNRKTNLHVCGLCNTISAIGRMSPQQVMLKKEFQGFLPDTASSTVAVKLSVLS